MDRLFSMSGHDSCLSQDFFPPIELDKNSSHALGLCDFNGFSSIPNVQRGKNNKFHFTIVDEADRSTETFVTIPGGVYEIDTIEKFLPIMLCSRGAVGR